MVILYCLWIKYILILVHNFLDHFDLKVFKESTKYASIRTLVVIAHSCDHLQSWNIFSVISATEESQVTSSDAELDVYNDPLRGKKTRWSKIVWKTSQWSFFVLFTSNLRMFCEWVFEAAKDLQISNFVTGKIKKQRKNNLLLDSMEQNA